MTTSNLEQDYNKTTTFQPHEDKHSLIRNKNISFQNWSLVGKIIIAGNHKKDPEKHIIIIVFFLFL